MARRRRLPTEPRTLARSGEDVRSGPLPSSLGKVVSDTIGPVRGAAGGAETLAGPKSAVTGTREFVEREREDFLMRMGQRGRG